MAYIIGGLVLLAAFCALAICFVGIRDVDPQAAERAGCTCRFTRYTWTLDHSCLVHDGDGHQRGEDVL